MKWKTSILSFSLVGIGVAMVGCGSAVDTAPQVASSVSDDPASGTIEDADFTLVTLDLPGMT